MATTSLKDVSLGIRDIGDRTDFAGTPAAADLSAEEDRLANALFTEGFISPTTSFEVNKGSAATMNVVVGSGASKTDLYIVPGTTAGQGNYIVRLEAATETFSIAAADPSNARIDEVYIVVQDNAYDSSGRALAVLAVREGDPASSPSAPGPDAGWDAYSLIATVDVPAAAADIIGCTVTDERTVSAPVMDIDAQTLDGLDSTDFTPIGHVGTNGGAHGVATTGTAGFMSSSDKSKLDGIEASADVNPTASEILTSIKTVDGSGSGLDADLLDGVNLAALGGNLIAVETEWISSSAVLSASDTVLGDYNIAKPSGWGSMEVLAMGTVYSGSTNCYAKVRFNNSNGQVGSTVSGAEAVTAAHTTTATGTLPVDLVVSNTGGTAFANGFLWVIIKIRKS